MLGLSGFYPKFVKKYANLNRTIEKAVKKYTRDIKLKKISKNNEFFKWIKIENKLDIKSSSTKLFNQNKYKIFALIIVLVLIAISLIF